MESLPIGAVILGLIVAIALIYFVVRLKSKEPHKPNYRLFFIIGVTWLPLGFATDNMTFTVMGILFAIIGLVNKSKWKDEPKWAELTPEAKKVKLMMIIGLVIAFILGLVVYFLVQSEVVG